MRRAASSAWPHATRKLRLISYPSASSTPGQSRAARAIESRGEVRRVRPPWPTNPLAQRAGRPHVVAKVWGIEPAALPQTDGARLHLDGPAGSIGARRIISGCEPHGSATGLHGLTDLLRTDDLTDAERADRADAVVGLHAEVERGTRHLHVLHASRLQCRSGCASCCVDELTVFEVEAARIRRHHAPLLALGTAHPAGACAFLDGSGACRIYADRPYVCRTQGLPLRWIEPAEDVDQELRDICPKNEAGEPLEELPEASCFTLGPVEMRLAELQIATALPSARTSLRALFGGRG